MTSPEQSIIKVLAYFNIFNYPLRKDEIYNFLEKNYDKACFEKCLNSLCGDDIVHRIDEFYSLQRDRSLAARRKAGGQMATKHLKIAGRISRFLFSFPFVKGIAVSGSLSKDFADKDSDIDFFIITKANRLWLARTLMHLFKKFTYLTGRQHWFCMNYFIDEMAFEIKEKNFYTAIEVMTVLPLQGNGVFKEFFAANKWTRVYFPVCEPRIQVRPQASKGRWTLKSAVEKIFDNNIGDKLNCRLMQITVKRWKKKAAEQQRSYRGELMALDAGLHYAKPDPVNFQNRILYRYGKEAEAFMMRLDNVKTVPVPSITSFVRK